MKNSILILTLIIFGLGTLQSCKKKGCTDPNANNFNSEAQKDDGSCTYPTINLSPAGDGDVTGNGGSATAMSTWSNGNVRAELNMDITSASGGIMTVVVNDADGNEVLNETLTVGVGDDSKTVCSAQGTPGEWVVTVTLTNFNGDGSYSLGQGC